MPGGNPSPDWSFILTAASLFIQVLITATAASNRLYLFNVSATSKYEMSGFKFQNESNGRIPTRMTTFAAILFANDVVCV